MPVPPGNWFDYFFLLLSRKQRPTYSLLLHNVAHAANLSIHFEFGFNSNSANTPVHSFRAIHFSFFFSLYGCVARWTRMATIEWGRENKSHNNPFNVLRMHRMAGDVSDLFQILRQKSSISMVLRRPLLLFQFKFYNDWFFLLVRFALTLCVCKVRGCSNTC